MKKNREIYMFDKLIRPRWKSNKVKVHVRIFFLKFKIFLTRFFGIKLFLYSNKFSIINKNDYFLKENWCIPAEAGYSLQNMHFIINGMTKHMLDNYA
jgi:hypothetical protein